MILTKLTIIVESKRPFLPDLNQARIRLACVEKTLRADGTIGEGDSVCAVSAIPMDREIIEDISVHPSLSSEWKHIRGRINYLLATLPFGEYQVLVQVDRSKKEVVYEPERFSGNVPCVAFLSVTQKVSDLGPSYLSIGMIHIVDAVKFQLVTKLRSRSKGKPRTAYL